MKKYRLYILCALLILSLSACAEEHNEIENNTTEYIDTISQSEAISDEITESEIEVTETEAEVTEEINESETSAAAVVADSNIRTERPTFSGMVPCVNGYWCLAGSCENGATVNVKLTTTKGTEQSIETLTVQPQSVRFFFSVKVEEGESVYVYVTATSEGKKESKAVATTLDCRSGAAVVAVGSHSQLHYYSTEYDYTGRNLFTDEELATLRNVIYKRLTTIQKRSGKETKLIFFIGPNCSSVYPEYVPTEWNTKKISRKCRRTQFVALIESLNDENIAVVDPTDFMKENKSLGKLYYQTDTHWNRLGGWCGYYKLMELISVDFPAAAPYTIDNYNLSTIEVEGGDLIEFMGMSKSSCFETTMECTSKIASQLCYHNREQDGVEDMIVTKVDNSDLPTAVVQRDSFGSAMWAFLIEKFSTLVYTPYASDASVSYECCEKYSPDYYIRIMVERDLYNKVIN